MSFDAIGIVSLDIKKSCDFYKILGLDFKQAGGEDHYEAILKSGIRVMLDSVELVKKLNPNFKKSRNTSITLCFKQESPSRVDELFKKIQDSGYEVLKTPYNAFWGQRYSSVFDPDGNQIDIFSDTLN